MNKYRHEIYTLIITLLIVFQSKFSIKHLNPANMNRRNKIVDLYHNPIIPGSYSGLSGFLKNNSSFTPAIVKHSLENIDTLTLHKPARKKGPRRRVYCPGIDKQWHVDLIDLRKYSTENDNKQWLLTIIDCFSKYGWCVALTDKRSQTVSNAFKEIVIKSQRTPNHCQIDLGKEFIGNHFQEMAKKLKINVFSTFSEIKNSICERFNRTIMEKIARYWTKNNTYRYVDILPEILRNYNNSYHRSIKTSPAKVNPQNEGTIYKNLFPDLLVGNSVPKFEVNDICRLNTYKGIFSKGYREKWTREKFRVKRVKNTNPTHYLLEALNGEEILGGFYDWELQKV